MLEFIRRILLELHAAGFPEAVCAGGALRDLYNGHTDDIKDIDIFIEVHENLAQKLADHFKGWTGRLVVPQHIAQYRDFENVHEVYEYQISEFPPIQLIVMSKAIEPRAIIERHDMGICQIAFDGYRQYATPAYDTDARDKTFTLIRCRDQKDYNRSMRRWERFSQRYVGWHLVAPLPESFALTIGCALPSNRTIYEVA